MSLTIEEKQVYVEFIEQVYSHSLHVRESDITPAVAEVCDQMMLQIRECSRKFMTAHAVFSIFYGGPILTAKQFITAFGKGAVLNVKKWLDTIRGHRIYRVCIVNTARNNRTNLEFALRGL